MGQACENEQESMGAWLFWELTNVRWSERTVYNEEAGGERRLEMWAEIRSCKIL